MTTSLSEASVRQSSTPRRSPVTTLTALSTLSAPASESVCGRTTARAVCPGRTLTATASEPLLALTRPGDLLISRGTWASKMGVLSGQVKAEPGEHQQRGLACSRGPLVTVTQEGGGMYTATQQEYDTVLSVSGTVAAVPDTDRNCSTVRSTACSTASLTPGQQRGGSGRRGLGTDEGRTAQHGVPQSTGQGSQISAPLPGVPRNYPKWGSMFASEAGVRREEYAQRIKRKSLLGFAEALLKPQPGRQHLKTKM